MSPPIEIVAAVIRDEKGRYLLVRKQGTAAFMQPGGKREPGEDDLTALAREIEEELGLAVVAGSERALGRFPRPRSERIGPRGVGLRLRGGGGRQRGTPGRNRRTPVVRFGQSASGGGRAADCGPYPAPGVSR